MALSAFLTVNGVEFPVPKIGFQYVISTTVDNARNTNNEVIGQRVGRDLFKLDQMEWSSLPAEIWQRMLAAVEDFFVPVTFEDYRTGEATTIIMYPGDRTAVPMFVDPVTHKVTKYESCKFNLIDAGRS